MALPLQKPPVENSPLAKPKAFRNALVAWFAREGKDYPWRQTRDPFAILVAEVMLQQTQITTVLGKGYYHRFLKAFPTFTDLADASDEQILKAWEGLGYYRRVRMLRAAAQAVVANGGVFPTQTSELTQLPGVGRYTAGALRAFAYELPAVLVDGNVARVITRLMDFDQVSDDAHGQRTIWQWAEQLADDARPWSYHTALMELGQTVCRPTQPQCGICPVSAFCVTRSPELLPVKRARQPVEDVTEHAIWAVDHEGRWLMHHGQEQRRQGLWKLPIRDEAALRGLQPIAQARYSITRFRVHLFVYHIQDLTDLAIEQNDHWVAAERLMSLAMPAPFRRMLETLTAEPRNSR